VRCGVTGHVDVAHPDQARVAVKTALVQILGLFPTDGEAAVGLEVLSSLAEGADRIVVEEALALLGADRVAVHAVLPLSAEDYLLDFVTDSSRRRFAELLDQAATVTRPRGTGSREEAYERAGRWVARSCDVLIALWDGYASRGRGGTAEIVRHARQLGVAVVVIPTVRASAPTRAARTADDEPRLQDGLAGAIEAHRRIHELNRGSITSRKLSKQLRELDAGAAALVAGSTIEWRYDTAADWALPRRARAERLAAHYQRLYSWAGAALYAFAALAVCSAAAQAVWHLSPQYGVSEVVLMLGLVIVQRLAQRFCLIDRWVGYRSLAETLRAAQFVLIAGADQIGAGAGSARTTTREAWYQRAFSESWTERRSMPFDDDAASETHEIDDLRHFLIEGWIEDQIEYHRRAAERFGRRHRLFSHALLVLFALTTAVAVIDASDVLDGAVDGRILRFLAIGMPAIGAALIGVRDQRQSRSHAERSERTVLRLRRLRRDAMSRRDLGGVQAIAVQAQTIMEQEALDWSGVVELQDLELVL
jgi:hypothetical protein